MKNGLKKRLWPHWERLAGVLARSYVVGPALENAIDACRRITAAHGAATIAYWNTEDEPARQVARAYLAALDALGKEKMDCYLSIKAPALRFDAPCWSEILERSGRNGVRLHFDALSPEEADQTFDWIASVPPRHPGVGCTLPARWRRSLDDAERVVERGWRVRVVKGQWADTVSPEVDWREGFLDVIDRLAGRARHVAVATHDAGLARKALGRLLESKTPCELELLFGLPLEPARSVAQAMGARVRVYLPYGHGWLPYCISQFRKNPRVFWWLLRDLSARLTPPSRDLRRFVASQNEPRRVLL